MDLAELLQQMSKAKGDNINKTAIGVDNEPTQQILIKVTNEVRQALEEPDAVSKLLVVIQGSDVETQETAAVFLRRKLREFRTWDVSLQTHNSASPLARSSIQLASSIFDNTLTETEEWSEILQWLESNCGSQSISCRQVVFNLITSITDLPDERMTHLIPGLLKLIGVGYSDIQSHQVRYAALKSAGNLVVHATAQNADMFMDLIAQAPEMIRSILNQPDMELDTDPFNILVESLSNSALMANTQLQPSLELAVEIACTKTAYEYLRKCALQYITEVVKQRSSVIIKLQAVDSLFVKVFELMCELDDSERDEDTLLHSCTQVIDILCQRLPSSTFVPIMQKYVDAGTKSPNTFVRRAAFLTLAVSMEGCCRFYVEHCLEQLIRLVLEGVQDTEAAVKMSAIFALGELLSYADTPANEYSALFMPVILDNLQVIAHTDFENADENVQLYISRVFYALEEACECLDNDLTEYLSDLFSKLKLIHEGNKSMRMHELCLESISFAVSAVDKLINPYVQDLLTLLSTYLADKKEDNERAFGQAMGALSTIFRYADDPIVRQHADSTVQFALNVLKEADCDPGLKSSAFDLLASLTLVYKENIDAELVKTITEEAIRTFKSTEGVMNLEHLTGTLGSGASLNGDLGDHTVGDILEDGDSDIDEEDEPDSDDDSDIDMIENEFSDERISALSMLYDLANNSESKFVPYIDSLLDLVFKHLDFPDENIQCQAMRSFAALLVAWFTRMKAESGDNFAPSERFTGLVIKFYGDIEEKIQEGDVHEIVIEALSAVQTLIAGLDEYFFRIVSSDKVAKVVDNVFNRKIPCLNTACDNDVDIEEPEQDSKVLEAAGDIIPTCGKALSVDEFKGLFNSSINLLLSQLKRPNSTRKAYVVGTIACILGCRDNDVLVDPDISYELFNAFIEDPSDEVAQNAAYGMGLLVSKMPEKFKPSCDRVLNNLHTLYQRASGEKSSLKDNVCGCACRIAQTLGAPIQNQLLEFIMSMIPIKSDRENYTAFFEMTKMFASEDYFKQKYFADVIHLACTLLLDCDEDILEETRKAISLLLRDQLNSDMQPAVMEIVRKFDEAQQLIISESIQNIAN